MFDFKSLIENNRKYNFHSHTEFCDGHATMQEMATAAADAGFSHYGFSPHSPVHIPSPCNMKLEDVEPFLNECNRISSEMEGKLNIWKGMEIDFIDSKHGPHNQCYQDFDLDYRIGSVHFVVNQKGEPWDCDGSPERFARYVHEHFKADLRYVVEKYFGSVCEMLSRGGFDMLGHFDKIARNAAAMQQHIEQETYYIKHIEEVISLITHTDITVEINTKYQADTGRLFPDTQWWHLLAQTNVPIVVNSDAHWPDKIDAGRQDTFALIEQLDCKLNI